MSAQAEIILKKGKAKSLFRAHPWIFSGAIYSMSDDVEPGRWVRVMSAEGQCLGEGHYAKASIAVRMLKWFDDKSTIDTFYQQKIEEAIAFRKKLGVLDNPETSCCRLVFGEGDGLPGLIIDKYGDVVVIQAHTLGMFNDLEIISDVIQSCYDGNLKAVYNKSKDSLKGHSSENSYLFGAADVPQIVKEYGHSFYVDWESGQKTGFFIDQRDNRALLKTYSKGKKILNTFCYTGGFSIYALAGNAELVHSVDVSERAINLTNENVKLAGSRGRHESYCVDVFEFLKNMEVDYDIIILDPPAFAKRRQKTHNAVLGYKRLNAMAMKKIKSGGLIFTFSCSQNIGTQLFEDTVRAAAIEANRNCRIMHRLGQPADHPMNLSHPEGHYLKGLVVEVR